MLRHVTLIYNQDQGYDVGSLPRQFWNAIDDMKGAYLAGQPEFKYDPIELVATNDSRRMTSETDKVLLCFSYHLYSIFSMASMPLASAFGHIAMKLPAAKLGDLGAP